MSNKIVYILAVVLTSCIQLGDTHIYYNEFENVELKNQINQYANYIDSIEPFKEKLLFVTFKQFDDSTIYFDISNEVYQESLKDNLTFNFLCKIGNRDVVFLDNATILKSHSFFKTTLDNRIEVIKRNFPHAFKNSNKRIRTVISYDPIDYHLIFKNGKLINKKIETGCMW